MVPRLRQYIGADVSFPPYCRPYCLCEFSHLEKAKRITGVKFVETSPINKPVERRKGYTFFTQKLHVQMANSHRSQQS